MRGSEDESRRVRQNAGFGVGWSARETKLWRVFLHGGEVGATGAALFQCCCFHGLKLKFVSFSSGFWVGFGGGLIFVLDSLGFGGILPTLFPQKDIY